MGVHDANKEQDFISKLIEWKIREYIYRNSAKTMSEGRIRNVTRGIVNQNAQIMCKIELFCKSNPVQSRIKNSIHLFLNNKWTIKSCEYYSL